MVGKVDYEKERDVLEKGVIPLISTENDDGYLARELSGPESPCLPLELFDNPDDFGPNVVDQLWPFNSGNSPKPSDDNFSLDVVVDNVKTESLRLLENRLGIVDYYGDLDNLGALQTALVAINFLINEEKGILLNFGDLMEKINYLKSSFNSDFVSNILKICFLLSNHIDKKFNLIFPKLDLYNFLLNSSNSFFSLGSLDKILDFIKENNIKKENTSLSFGKNVYFLGSCQIFIEFPNEQTTISIIIGKKTTLGIGITFFGGKQNFSIRIGKNCSIGDLVTLSDNITICDNASIGKGVVIGEGVTLGNGVVIGNGAIIGNNMVIPDFSIVPDGMVLETNGDIENLLEEPTSFDYGDDDLSSLIDCGDDDLSICRVGSNGWVESRDRVFEGYKLYLESRKGVYIPFSLQGRLDNIAGKDNLDSGFSIFSQNEDHIQGLLHFQKLFYQNEISNHIKLNINLLIDKFFVLIKSLLGYETIKIFKASTNSNDFLRFLYNKKKSFLQHINKLNIPEESVVYAKAYPKDLTKFITEIIPTILESLNFHNGEISDDTKKRLTKILDNELIFPKINIDDVGIRYIGNNYFIGDFNNKNSFFLNTTFNGDEFADNSPIISNSIFIDSCISGKGKKIFDGSFIFGTTLSGNIAILKSKVGNLDTVSHITDSHIISSRIESGVILAGLRVLSGTKIGKNTIIYDRAGTKIDIKNHSRIGDNVIIIRTHPYVEGLSRISFWPNFTIPDVIENGKVFVVGYTD